MRTAHGSALRPALLLATLSSLLLSACGPDAVPSGGEAVARTPGAASRVLAPSPEAAGRYLVLVGGCNDCHTDGFLVDPTGVPEAAWLKGSVVGFRGPWGTTYPKNLRLTAASLTEDQWVERLQAGGMPPMPWYNVSQMSEEDARAVYRYIRSLGEPGAPAPLALAPGVEPGTPWIDFVPKAGGPTAGGA